MKQFGATGHFLAAVMRRAEFEHLGGDPPGTTEREREFVAFYRLHFSTALRRARYVTLNSADVEDVCALVFTLAYRRFDELRALAPPQAQAWLSRSVELVAANIRRSEARRWRLIVRLERQRLPEPPGPVEAIEDADLRASEMLRAERTRTVIADLEGRHQEVLRMAEFERLSGPEIAAELGITAQAARLRLMRARNAFRDEYVRRFGAEHDVRGGLR